MGPGSTVAVITAMKFIVKYFPEIAIKSRPVRRHFVAKLSENLRAVLREIDPGVVVRKQWDRLQVEPAAPDDATGARLADAMCHVPGVTYVLEVREYPLPPLERIVDHVLPVYGERLAGRTFAVRCRRSGSHDFTSMDVERVVGSALQAQTAAAGVRLKNRSSSAGGCTVLAVSPWAAWTRCCR